MNQYPLTLPGPSKIMLKPAERRRGSSLTEGLQQVRTRQQDFLGVEEVEWEFVASHAEIFDAWWKGQLVYGGGWFAAGWPSSHRMAIGNRRFISVPKWTLIGHEYWRVSAQLELRSGTLNDSPSGGAVGMEPGGIRPYDLYLIYAFSDLNPRAVDRGALQETTYTWNLRVTTHNTAVAIAAGPVVEFTCVEYHTPTTTWPIYTYTPQASTTVREASLREYTATIPFVFKIDSMGGWASIPQTYILRASVDGVDVGQGYLLTVTPDVTSGAWLGGTHTKAVYSGVIF